MSFVSLTDPEYKRILKKLMWRSPFVKLWTTKKLFWLFIFFWIAFTVSIYTNIDSLVRLFVFLGLDYEVGISGALFRGFLIACVFIAGIHIIWLLDVPFQWARYKKAHTHFVSCASPLNKAQMDALMSEYPNRKRIEIIYHKRTRMPASACIYITDSFLFVPGLLLVFRQEIEEILIVNTTRDNNRYRPTAFVLPETKTHIEFLTINGAIECLPFEYSHNHSPRTAEQVMAWFWQCDDDDSEIPEKTRNLIEERVYD